MTTRTELQDLLRQITREVPDGAFFLENSRQREMNYSEHALERWLEIIHLIEGMQPRQRCLDVGVTPLTFALKRYFSEVEALDYSNDFAARCESGGVKLHVGGGGWTDELLPDDYYDCINFLEVIEHLHMNPETILRYFRKKLRPGGWLILSTPNLMSLGNRIRMLFNRKLDHFSYPPFAGEQLHGHSHDRIYSPAEMRDYFKNTGWSEINIGYHGVAVFDSIKPYPPLQKVLRAPVQVIKHLVPSTRQQLLARARK